MGEARGKEKDDKGEESDWATLLSGPQSKREKVEHTHTDLPSVNRVCKRGRGEVWAREGKALRAAFVFVQLVFVPPGGVLISALRSLFRHITHNFDSGQRN